MLSLRAQEVAVIEFHLKKSSTAPFPFWGAPLCQGGVKRRFTLQAHGHTARKQSLKFNFRTFDRAYADRMRGSSLQTLSRRSAFRVVRVPKPVPSGGGRWQPMPAP
ncbi:hypothetical protein [Rhizobium sp. Leaf383]|uniref:hypothetical protein n=1 Tax=Rhizobium sp. Leaf383 TaxID=1736357 RepID=UPI000A5C3721|nr:hypothetical protein [Rhizobium sp. Leaf383]